MSTLTLSRCLESLLLALPPHPVDEQQLNGLVSDAISKSLNLSTVDNRKSQWECLLRAEVFKLAEASVEMPSYFDGIWDRLDIVLTFTEHDVCDQAFPFNVLEDLLDTQTVESCSHIFSWIEQRSSRLMKGMVPQKGKALVLLRTLNDLLRRLSKTGNTTIFCGRILTFLSAVFPLGERSGVNLRGDYGPPWEDVTLPTQATDSMEIDGGESSLQNTQEREERKKAKFYNTFWSLQSSFSQPALVAQPGAFDAFKSSVEAVLPVFKEATVRERAMMGSKSASGNLKRKRDQTTLSTSEDSSQEYFFSKYLTSPDLLDLEISDTSFRRQFLFQLLILLTHLSQFTKTEKSKWMSTRNRSLQMDFTLEAEDAKWVEETIAKSYEEMRQTTPNGRAFAETIQIILDRERNWVRWKNDLCVPFDKDSLHELLADKAAPLLEKARQPLEEYTHKLGSNALTEIWAMGYRDLNDLEARQSAGSVKDFVKDIERENNRIALRKQQLTKQAQRIAEAKARAAAVLTPSNAFQTPENTETMLAVPPPQNTLAAPSPQKPATVIVTSIAAPLHPSLPAKPGTVPLPVTPKPSAIPSSPAPAPAPVISSGPQTPAGAVRSAPIADPIISKADETKQRLSWLALRTARDEHLRHFGKIGNGDILALMKEIDKEKEAESEIRGDDAGQSHIEESSVENIEANDSGRGSTPTSAEPGSERSSQGQAKPLDSNTASAADTSDNQLVGDSDSYSPVSAPTDANKPPRNES